jgi:UDPglucose--hexose-1-phosphate uridylyltransferase
MQELRVDELTGAQVIVAPSRATRPGDAVRVDPVGHTAAPSTCPFCRGNETMTPPEVARTGSGAPETPGWRVRVVPNLYPIVGAGVDGAHEVVILSPAHAHDLGALDDTTAFEVVRALRDRAHHHLVAGLRHAQPFVNHGRAAGASIAHPHAQLVVLGVVPPRVDELLERFDRSGGDLLGDAAADARTRDVVIADGEVVSWCPVASWSPFMVRCAPAASGPRFDLAGDDELAALTVVLRDSIARIQRVVGDLAYNVVVNTAPRDDARTFRWWVDIVPRLTVLAGFELGAGMFVNVVPPEAAAAALRDAAQ